MNTNWLKSSSLFKGVNVINKKMLLCIYVLPTVLFLVTSCTLNKDEGSNSTVLTQSSIENSIESYYDVSEDNSKNGVRMVETDKDEDFYKKLILRLFRNEIEIMDGENKYYFSDTVSVNYEKMLPESKFYIVDINGDKKLDIGIRFPNNVLLTYYYNDKTDTLRPALGYHIYTEILGNGQVMMASSSSSSTGTFYKVIDISGNRINTIAFFKDYMRDNILPNGSKEPMYEYSIDLEMRLPDGTRSPNTTSSTVEVSKEQWDMMKRPFEDLRKNAPKPFNYGEIMAVES